MILKQNLIVKLFLHYYLVCFILSSCFEEKAGIPMEDVIGKWKGQSWLVKGEDVGRDASRVKFEFNSDSTYYAAMGSQDEKGIFRLVENKLYTTAQGDAEKNVELSKVNADSMVMMMNRQGTMETLVLVRAN